MYLSKDNDDQTSTHIYYISSNELPLVVCKYSMYYKISPLNYVYESASSIP
jgi:hypothetical protein